MPDPKKYDSEDGWMAACVPRKVGEGQEQDQAMAACLNIWRRKDGDEGAGGEDRPAGKELSPFMVWKEAAGGRYRWRAVFSNKFRDGDHPPEILAEEAHKDFEAAVDAGAWPMPELWLWHVKGTRAGAADWVAYDDAGFMLASGLVDEDKERIASRLAGRDDLLTSHGMPVVEIERDKDDPSIITRYRTKEISPLPRWAAANKHGTGFTILKEVGEMSLPEKKRPFLAEVMGEEAVADLERQLADKAKDLEDQGIEFKEQAPAAPAKEDGGEPAAPEAEAPAAAPAPQYVTHGELEEVFGGYVKPLFHAVRDLTARVEALGKELKEQAAAVEGLQADDEAKIKAAMAQTPAASLFARVGSVIGADETFVDGREKLAKSKPKEAAPEAADGPTLVPWLNQLMAQQRGG